MSLVRIILVDFVAITMLLDSKQMKFMVARNALVIFSANKPITKYLSTQIQNNCHPSFIILRSQT